MAYEENIRASHILPPCGLHKSRPANHLRFWRLFRRMISILFCFIPIYSVNRNLLKILALSAFILLLNNSPVYSQYPVVAGTATSAKTSGGTVHTISLPVNIASGDLILIFWDDAAVSNISPVTPTGFTQLYAGNSGFRKFRAWYKIATGTEGTSITVNAGNERSAHTSYRISSGTFAGLPAAGIPFTNSIANPNPDPPYFVSGFGTVPTLWIATAHSDGDDNSSTPVQPALYSSLITGYTGTLGNNDARMTTAQRDFTAAAENPGQFMLASSVMWGANTVAIAGCINSTLTLTSAQGTDHQVLCNSEPLVNITYAVGGSATGAVVTGLPTGTVGVYNAGVFTISGNPTQFGFFSYTVTTTGTPPPCNEASAFGNIFVIEFTASCDSVSPVCINAAPFTLTNATPGGGTYSGPGVTPPATFNPASAGAGNHLITYSVENDIGCIATCSFWIKVLALPVVTCPSNFAVCINAPPVTLTGGTPAGGTYSGTGVSGGIFTPSAAGAGTHTITYTYTDPVTSCTNSCTFTITVNALPTVTCPANFSVCVNAGPVTLAGGLPAGGSYSGPGVSAGIFNPAVAGVGTHTITYTYTSPSTGCTNSCTFTITVKPIPLLTSSLSAQSVCSGAQFFYHPTSNVPGTVFSWTRAVVPGITPATGSGTGDILETLFNSTNGPRTVHYLITLTANGCTNPFVYDLPVVVNPIPNFTSSLTPPPICSGSVFIYTPASNVSGATFTWSRAAVAGISEPPNSGTGGVNEVLTNTTPLQITVVYAYTVSYSGCTNPSTFNVQVIVKPVPVLTSSLTPPGICSGTIFSYTPTSGTPGTIFAWIRAAVPGIAQPPASGTGNPNEVLTNTTSNPITVIYAYHLSASGCTNPNAFNVSVVVSPQPVLISDPTPPDICSGTVFSYEPQSNVSGTTFQWSRASIPGILPLGTIGTGNPNEVLVNTTALPITVSYVYTLTAAGCQNPATFNVDVVVNPIPLLTSSLTPPAICSGTVFNYTPTSNTPGTTFQWSRAAVAGISNPPASGFNNPAEILNNITNVTVNVTYVYTLTANGCSHVQNVVVSVKPLPTVNPVPDQTWCHGASVPVTIMSGPVSGTTFAWVNNNPSIGLGPAGTGNIPAFTATNLTNNPIVATVTITPSANGCTGPAFSYTITVYPAPVLTSSLTPPPICSGTLFSYTPESNIMPAVFNWTRAAVAGIANPAASGTGNPNEMLVNTTVNPVSVTYVYTIVANGCSSPSTYNVVVVVNPTPTLTSTLTPQAICSNTLFSYTPTSGTPGTVFNWTRPAVAGISNPPASGTGNPNEILINTTTAPVSVTYIYTLTANNCSNIQNVIVVVKPTPSVDPLPNQSYCSGETVPETILTGPVSGTTFNWINNNTGIGLGASGTGNVPSFIATNTTSTPIIATITVTPTAANCPGTSISYTITVYPSATVSPVSNQLYCNGDAAPETPLTGPIPGTIFTWTNSNPAIGLAAGGTGNVPAFTATNGTNIPVSAIITITPSYGSCPGIPSSYTITVNPTPTVDTESNQSYCEGASVPANVITGPVTGTVFNWVNSNPGIGLGASGTGNVPAFTAANSTPNPISGTITITPSANNCTGPAISYTIIVNPTPELSSPLNPPGICSESQFYYIATSQTNNVIFSWSRAVIPGISNPAGSGIDIIDEVLENTTFNPIPVIYQFTLTANGCSNTQNVVVVVSPLPTMTSPDPPPTLCSNSLFSYTPSGPVSGTIFAWTRAAVPGIQNPAVSGVGSISEILINTTTGPIAVTYVYTMSAPGCTNPEPRNIVVVVVPAPVVTASASETQVCEGEPFNLFSSSNLGPTMPPILLSSNFNSTPTGWTTLNQSSGGTPANAAWTLRPDGYTYNFGIFGGGNVTFHSNDNSQFYLSNSRAQGFGGTTNTILRSPAINTVGYTTLQLDFWHCYNDNTSDNAYVEVSTNGTTWASPTPPYNSDRGSPNSFQHETINLSLYTNNTTLYIRFRYSATYDYYWAIDNVTVSGTSPIPACTWTSIPPGFTSSVNNPVGVSQSQTTSYIATYVDNQPPYCPGSDTVTVAMAPVPAANITANYCAIPQKILLTAYPSGCTYLWNTGETTQSIQVDIVGVYSVTVTNSFGCSRTAYINVANELVTDGSFTNFVAASPSFFTEYTQNQAWFIPPPFPGNMTGLYPEGWYAVNISAWYNPSTSTGYHPDFHGQDHTNNSVGPRNFMMINGSTTTIEDPPGSGNWRQRIIWQQTVTVQPNTDYYFSAWGMNLHPTNCAILQFEVNGTLVGSIANLTVAPKPTSEAQVNLANWVRFYSTPFWNSGSATTAVIRIRNLNTIAGGNDFGLDDISFGTLSPVPAGIDPEANGGSALCEGDTLYLEANIQGGLPPIHYLWTGPNGFSDTLQNPVIPNVTTANAGWYILSVTDGYGCPPVLDSTLLTIIPSPEANLSPGDTSVCVNDPEPIVVFTATSGTGPFTFHYTFNGGPLQDTTTVSGNSISIPVPTNNPGTFMYILVTVDDQTGCDRDIYDTCTITVAASPGCLIAGDTLLCPNSRGNIYTGPPGMINYEWTVSGNGAISGTNNQDSVIVNAGSGCNNPLFITLNVTNTNNCDSTCSIIVPVRDNKPPDWTTPVGTLDRTVECSDATGLANAQGLTPAADDSCTSAVLPVKTAGNFIPGSCAQAGTYTNTWNVSDSCGNAASPFIQIITITDTTSPVWDTPAGALDITLECDDLTGLIAAQAMMPEAQDNCDISLVPVKNAGPFVPGICANSGTYTNTFTVSDDCGNPGTVYTQVITINDITDPEITCPNSVSIDCDESYNPANTGSPVVTDNCDPSPAVTYSDVIIPGFCPNAFTIQRTWTATDACGNYISCMQVISVQDVSPPVLAGVPPDATVPCDAIPNPPIVTATDNCDLSVTVNYTQVINVTNGCGSITRTWTATDDCGNTVTATQLLTVVDLAPPVLQGVPADIAVPCDNIPVAPTVTVTDNCDPGVTVTYTETINTVTGGCGEIVRTWSSTDYCGNTVTETQTITVEDTEPPVWLTLPGALDVTLQCNDIAGLIVAQSLEPVPSDNCYPDLVPVKISGSFVPGSCPQAGTYTNTWTVSDYCGNTSNVYTQVITIIDNTAPAWDQPQHFLDRNLSCDDTTGLLAALALAPTATDNCGTVVTISLVYDEILPGSCAGTFTRTREWSATDNCNNINAIHYVQTINVSDNSAPEWNTVPGALDISVPCNDADSLAVALSMAPFATDECNSGVQINLTGDEIYNGSCPGVYMRIRSWTAEDDCGNINPVVYIQTITVDDEEEPVFYNIPPGVTISCENPLPPVPLNIMAYDYCSDDVTYLIVFNEGPLIPDPACPNGGTITRTWTVDDLCGNIATASQVITVEDNTPPSVTCPVSITVPADQGETYATVYLNPPVYWDNCTDTIQIAISWQMSGATNGSGLGLIPVPYQFNEGTTTVTYFAADECLNVSSCQFTVTVNPNDPPEISCPGDIIAYTGIQNCTATLDPGMPDTLSGTPPFTWKWIMTGETSGTGNTNPIFPNPYTFNLDTTYITWIASNISGSDTCTQRIIVLDTVRPEIISPGPFEFCVQSIDTASWNGLVEPNTDIVPERPDWYIIEPGNMALDLDTTQFTDNCCLANQMTILWQINFTNGHPPVSGTGQPSQSAPIKLWGTTNNINVIHTITYVIVDCNGNPSIPEVVDILIRPRPNVIKM